MDQERFDRIARLLGQPATRRGGMAGAMAAAAAAAVAIAGEVSAKHRRERPEIEGPCGDGSRKANTCRKDSQCCTGFCLKDLKNKDSKGRCRCIRKGEACKPSQTCCNGRDCVDGVCGGNAKETCVVCASGCPFTSVSEAYATAPEGSVITIDAGRYGTGISVTKSVTLKACNDVAGVILYPDGSVKTDYSNPPQPVIIAESPSRTAAATVTLIGLNLEPSAPAAVEMIIEASDWGVPVGLGFVIRDCDITGPNNFYSVILGPGAHSITDSTIHDCTGTAVYAEVDYDSNGNKGITVDVIGSSFVDNGSYGLSFDGEKSTSGRPYTVLTASNSTFSRNGMAGIVMYGGTFSVTNCTVQDNGDLVKGEGGILITGATVSITDTTISGNSSFEFGGGLKIATFETEDISVTVAGTTSITGNSSPEGSGVGVDASENSVTVTVTGTSTSNVNGNTGGDQCDRSTVFPYSWTNVPTCAF